MEFTVSVLGTIGAVEAMVTEEKLKSGISQSRNTGGVEIHFHTITDGFSAGSDWGISALNFYETEATGSKRRFGLSDGAQVRNIESVIQSCPEDAGTFFSLDFDTINSYSNQFLIPLLEACQFS